MTAKISSSEWEVMNVVWDKHPLTAVEVFKTLPNEKEWKQKTVNTFLTRLAGKGILEVSKEGKAHLYAPKMERADCVASEGASFLQRVFKGAAGSLVLHFCENADLTVQEIRELEQILKAKKGKR
jgi:BlaI family penicillinase repressor